MLAILTCLKSNEPAVRYDHYQLHQDSPKDRKGAGSNNIADYKPKYMSRDMIRVLKACTS